MRWRGGLLAAMAVLALAVLAVTFAYRAMLGGYVFRALLPIVKAGTGPDNIVRNNSDIRRDSSQTSITSDGSSEKLQPIDIREAPKAAPRVISTIPISSKPSAAAVTPLAPAPAATAPALDPPVASALDQHVAPSVPPPASAPVPVPASSEPTETAAVAPVAREPGAPSPALAPPLLTAASVPPPASAPSEPTEINRVIVAPDGWGETDTPSPGALADPQGDAVPSPSSRSPMQARSGTALKVSFGGAYAVQVASQRSAAEARASFRALRAKFPNQLGGHEPIVRRTDLGAKGIYYRAMVGPFASMEKAAGMCRTLKVAGCNCLVQRN